MISLVNRCSECGRNKNCTLVPFIESDPCYQGPQSEIQTLKSTNPLVKNTTISCESCIENNFNFYLRNDLIYRDVQLFTSSLQYCSQCSLHSNCLIVPLTQNKSTDICSQGNHSQIQLKYNLESNINDKYLSCGYCKEFGFSEYYRNDIIFSKVTEWISPSNVNNNDDINESNGGNSNNNSLLVVTIFLFISGFIIGSILILLFRKSIWKNNFSFRRKGYSLIVDENIHHKKVEEN